MDADFLPQEPNMPPVDPVEEAGEVVVHIHSRGEFVKALRLSRAGLPSLRERAKTMYHDSDVRVVMENP